MIRPWPVFGQLTPQLYFFFLLELMLLWQTGCQHSEHSSVTASTSRLTAPLTPSFPLRSEESALQASRCGAEECQEALWRSEPTANEQRRSGHVSKRSGSAHVIGGEKVTEIKWKERERRAVRWLKVKWRTKSAAAIEMNMYIYYIRIHVIPCLWCSSFPQWTETCLGLNLSVWKVDLQTLDKPSAWIYSVG